jgi:DNA-binding NarL/FixJ family response regulator
MFLEVVSAGLTRTGHEICAVTQDPTQVAELVADRSPDVCVIDAFPDGSGVTAAGGVHQRTPRTRILLLAPEATAEVWRGYASGTVDGVVNTGCELVRLARCVEQVAAGHRVVEGWSAWPPPSARPAGAPERLTSREVDVLSLLARGASTRAMAQTLGVSENTVRTHVQNLLHKTGARRRGQAVSLAVARRLLVDELTPGLSTTGGSR